MKKLLLSLLAIATLGTAATQAATKYEINVAGVEVTSDNASGVTGGDIKSGTVTYNASTNVLTLNNVTITRSGGDNYCIHNRKKDNLTIRFTGTCNLTSDKANALHLDRATTVEVASGATANLKMTACANERRGVVYVNGVAAKFQGGGTLNINATYGSKQPVAFEGTGATSSSTLTFTNLKADVNIATTSTTYSNTIYKFKLITFQSSIDLKFYLSSYAYIGSFYDIGGVSFTGGAANVSYPDATFDSNETYGNSYGGKYTHITDDYGVIISTANFPDENFRTYMRSLCSKNDYGSEQYLTKTELQNLTSLNVNDKSISDLTGVTKLTYLKTLYCNGNSLTTLPTLPSSITTLYCYNNKLTSLPALPSGLTYLNCMNNQISQLPSLPGTLQYLYCGGNKLYYIPSSLPSSLQILNFNDNELSGFCYVQNCKNLKTLEVANNTAMTGLDCSGNALTSLNVTGCTALKTLRCYNNSLSSLISPLPGSLTELTCYNNQLTSLPTLPGTITTLYCGGNKFTTLTITGKTALTTLNANGNTLLTKLDCNSNALTSLTVTGCTALKTLDCSGNKLTALSLPEGLQVLNMAVNQFSSDLSTVLPSSIQEVYCGFNNFTTLKVTGKANLTKFIANNNNSLTTVNIYNNPKLSDLDFYGVNSITSLDCHGNAINYLSAGSMTKLETLYASDNKITVISLPSTSDAANTTLKTVNLAGNQLTKLKINKFNALTTLNVGNNPLLTDLNCSGNALTSLNVSGCTALYELDCSSNALDYLGLATNAKLNMLYASYNKLTNITLPTVKTELGTLDVCYNDCDNFFVSGYECLWDVHLDGCTKLTNVEIKGCKQLAVVTVTGCTALKTLTCAGGWMETLDLSEATALEKVYCQQNSLTSLTLSPKATNLGFIANYCNKLTGAAVDAMIASLPQANNGVLNMLYSTDENNTVTAEQVKAAKAKGWNIWYSTSDENHWSIYTGENGLKGDVNGDGSVNAADVTALYNYILNGDTTFLSASDVNGDGSVNAGDVTAVYNIILGL